jgi:hypothetical protein
MAASQAAGLPHAVIAELPADPPSSQMVTRGVALFDPDVIPLKPLTFAIVG